MEFRLLGPLEVWHSGVLVPLGGPKQRRVLAALALRPGRVVPVDQLVDAVWDSEPPATARRQVQNAVSALRQTPIGAVLAARGPGYVLRVPVEQVDAGQFDGYQSKGVAARAARDLAVAAEALQAGLALWRGPALAGVGGRTAGAAAAHLEEQRLSVLTDWAEIVLELGRPAAVVDELAPVVDRHPLREPMAGLLMLALYRCGRAAESLACYHRVRKELADELGVDPGPQLRDLYEQVLTSDPALDHRPATPPRRNDLPRDIVHFTGRAAELDELMSIVDTEGGAVVIQAIDGMAGVGKTALAVHASHRLADRYPDGQLFVDLHAHTPGREPLTAEAALDLVLRAVGVPDESIPKDADEKAARWRAELAGRRVLVVLDNAFGAAQVRPLLPGTPRCAVLITSRRRLTDLDGSRVQSLDTLPGPDAEALFRRVAGGDRTGDEPAAVADVVRLCGHLPLAIAIVAGRMRTRGTWTVGDLARRLAGQRDRPDLLRADDRGVAAAFTLSYQHLSAEEQHMYRLLGLHPGTDIDAYSAAALADLPIHRAERLLDALCDVHLLIAHRGGHYRFHDLVCDHARAAVASDETGPEQAAARARLLDYYLHVSGLAADLVVPTRRRLGAGPERPPAEVPALSQLADAWSWFLAEQGNWFAIARLAAEHSRAGHGWEIPRNIAAFLWRYGDFAAGAAMLRVAVDACGPGTDPAARVVCLSNLALMHQVLGRYAIALDCLAQSAAIAREAGDRRGEASALTLMAEVSNHTGAYAQAITFASGGIELYHALDDWPNEMAATADLVDALVSLGRPGEAIDAARPAMGTLPAHAGERSESLLISRTGKALSHLGEHDRAIEVLTRAGDIARTNLDRPGEANCLYRLAHALRRAGRPAEALARAREALDLVHDVPDPAELAEAHNALGDAYRDLDQPDEALRHHREALAVAVGVGYRIGEAQALHAIGLCLDAVGDPADAKRHQQDAVKIFDQLGVPADARSG